MAHVIAVAGKGGVGKTTLCGMLIQYLCEKGKGPILAVDADANSNLNEVLGVEVETTLGDVREEIARAELASENPIPAGMSKADYAERRFEDALVEDDDFDLLVMGRTQGKGCYCFVNGLLQTQLAKYQNNYPYIVVDWLTILSVLRIASSTCLFALLIRSWTTQSTTKPSKK